MDYQWLETNAIAIYGAVVGTIALFLNVGRFWIMYQKTVRKLKVESTHSSSAQHQINASIESPFDVSGNKSKGKPDPKTLIGPLYKITVRNVSHNSMHIHDVGLLIKTENGKGKHNALVRGRSYLQKLEDTGGDDLPAGSNKTYDVWISGDLKLPDILGCYVVDQLNKKYQGKHITNGMVLTVPEFDESQA